MKKTIFTGAAVAIVTPFNENGINFEELKRLIDFNIDNGTDAIVIAGTTGESSTMSDEEHKEAAGKMRNLLALYRENKDLIDVGMYQMGSNPKLDVAIELMPQINAFLQQRTTDIVSMDTTIGALKDMMRNVNL